MVDEYTQCQKALAETLKLVGVLSGRCGGASLQQEGVAHVAHPHRPRVGGQGQLVTGTAVAVDVSTVSTVVLSACDGELLLTLLALSGLIIFQPGVALQSFVDLLEVLHLKFRLAEMKSHLLQSLFLLLTFLLQLLLLLLQILQLRVQALQLLQLCAELDAVVLFPLERLLQALSLLPLSAQLVLQTQP